MTGKAQMRCSRCGQLHEITLHSSINAMQEPALKASVKDGSLFVWECPHCGTANLARYACLYHDPQERLMIWLLPDGPVPETASVAATLDSLDGYTLRRVKDVGSLIEKVNLFDAGLEDTVMEMCKYVTRMELAEKDRSLADIPLKFLRLDGADNELLFSYPKDGQMHVYDEAAASDPVLKTLTFVFKNAIREHVPFAGFLNLSNDHAGFNDAYYQQNKEKAVAQAVSEYYSRKTVSLKILSRVSGISVFHALLASSGREPAVGRRSPVRRMALRDLGFPAISSAPG